MNEKIRFVYLYVPFCLFLLFVSYFGPSMVCDIIFFSLMYAIASIGWAIGMYAGQLSFGHAAFFGIGAYVAAISYVKYHVTPWVAFIIAPLISTLLAVAITFPSARYGVRGPFYSLLTLALAEVMRTTFLAWDFTGRALGVWYPIVPDSLIDFQFHSTHAPYVAIALIILTVGLSLLIKMQQTRVSYGFITTRNDEDAAQAIGVDTLKFRVLSSALSAIITSMSGILYAQFTLFVSPENAIGTYVNVDILLPAVIGGVFSPYGPLLGSFIINPLMWLFRILFGAEVLHMIIRGILLVTMVYISPRGLIGLFTKISSKKEGIGSEEA
jgi:branched-chain amino acid transport system permease protein